MTLHANLFNTTVFPAMLYASETWATTKEEEQRLVNAQRVMERSILKILLCEHIQSEVIKEQTRVKDVIAEYQKQ